MRHLLRRWHQSPSVDRDPPRASEAVAGYLLLLIDGAVNVQTGGLPCSPCPWNCSIARPEVGEICLR